MPPPEYSARHQKLVRWAKSRTNRYGDPDRGDPEELCVRWEFTRKDMMAPDGTRTAVDAVVTYGPSQTFQIDDTVWLGELEDWYGTGSAGNDSGVYRVAAIDYVPDIKGRAAYREAGLIKASDALPTRY